MYRVAGSMRLITQLDSLVDTSQTERGLCASAASAAYFPGERRRLQN